MSCREEREETKQEVYQFIKDFMITEGYSPTVREIQTAIGLSSPSVALNYISLLQRDGKITTKNNMPRTISLCGYKLVKIKNRHIQTTSKENTLAINS